MELQEKILDAFTGKVVRKDLAFLVKGNLPVPTYVLEYLLGQYCASDDEAVIEEGLEKTVRWYLDNQEWMDRITSGEYEKYYEEMYKGR